MAFIPPISIGTTISNKQLSALFKVGNMGGMRRSMAAGTLVLICDNTKGLYRDKWHDGLLLYTGMGKIGDQTLEGNQNKTLAESNTNGVTVYLFEVYERGQYVFAGQVRLAAKPYQSTQPDDNGEIRKVWIFPLEKVSDENGTQNQTGTLELPPDKQLNITALTDLFSVMNQSYKLFWFRSILEGIREGKSSQRFEDIVEKMAADAWYLVAGLQLKLGPADAVERLIRVLKKDSGLPDDADRNTILSTFKASDNTEVRKLKQRLIENVPYRLMSPFMKDENWRYWDNHALTIARINSNPSTLYTLGFERGLDTAIYIRLAWMEYLKKNLAVVWCWTDEKLIAYLQKQNPDVDDIREKRFEKSAKPAGEAAHSQAIVPAPVVPEPVVIAAEKPKEAPGKRKILTPRQKLWRRIKREFPKKKLIGDIAINDEEFELLVQELCNQHRRLLTQPEQFEADEIFCVALVQFGIRYYDDGAYWPFIEERVNPGYFKTQHRTPFGKAFLDYMRANEKLLNEDKKVMSNILLHGFVSDHKSSNFFEYLYSYYRIDLARDINMLTRDEMNALIENIKANDGSKGTYNLVEHTSDAVRLNVGGSKTRIRRYLKMIDKAFWNPDEFSVRSENRLMKRFAEWWNSDEEQIEKDRSAGGGIITRHRNGWKPYLTYDYGNDSFSLVLPARLVRGTEEPEVYWEICYGGENKHIDVDVNAAVTGYVTDEYIQNLSKEEVFGAFELSFFCNGEQQNKWKIPADQIRFFETNGDHVEPKVLRPGDVISFSALDYIPVSEAMYDSEDWDGLLRCSYQFEDGDVILFPDKKVLNIGKKPAEGLLKRGLQNGVFGLQDDRQYPVYASAPSMFARIHPKSMNGTQLRVNGQYYRLFVENEPEPGVLVFDLQERVSEMGVHISLSRFGVRENGLYHVELDIPNDHADRKRDFLLIDGLQYSFDEAPYIFVETGILSVPEETGLKAYDDVIREGKEDGQLRFAFAIPEDDAYFRLGLSDIPIAFEIPKLSYRFQGENEWRTKLQVSIWHKDLPEIVEIRYPADKLTILLDEEGNEDEDSDQHKQTYSRNQEKGCFICDLHPFRSWYGRRVATRRLYVLFPGMKKEARFLNIYTKDVFISAVLSADLEKDIIHGEFDIIGKAPCYADLWFEDRLLLEKEPIVDGKISLRTEVLSGVYQVDVYESDTDEDGFDEPDYNLLATKSMELINPTNLTGSHIEITQLMRKDSESYLRLKRSYTLYDLKAIEGAKKGCYSGHMVVREREYGKYRDDYTACIYIPDPEELSRGYLYWYDEKYHEKEDFIYDHDRHFLLKEEDRSVKGVARYRRFRYLWGEDYIYRLAFVEKPEDMDEKLEAERAERALQKQGKAQGEERKVYLRKLDPLCKPIRELMLPISIRNELVSAGIEYTTDLKNMTFRDFARIKGLNRSDIEQCIVALRRVGYKISMF